MKRLTKTFINKQIRLIRAAYNAVHYKAIDFTLSHTGHSYFLNYGRTRPQDDIESISKVMDILSREDFIKIFVARSYGPNDQFVVGDKYPELLRIIEEFTSFYKQPDNFDPKKVQLYSIPGVIYFTRLARENDNEVKEVLQASEDKLFLQELMADLNSALRKLEFDQDISLEEYNSIVGRLQRSIAIQDKYNPQTMRGF